MENEGDKLNFNNDEKQSSETNEGKIVKTEVKTFLGMTWQLEALYPVGPVSMVE